MIYNGEGKSRRISKTLLKELPKTVSNEVSRLKEDYQNLKSAWIGTVSEGHTFHCGEGERYVVIINDRVEDVEMVHSNTVGASGLNYDIGGKFTPPVGTWIIRVYYYTKYWMDICNVVPRAISAPNL
jgi:hypothetical protein